MEKSIETLEIRDYNILHGRVQVLVPQEQEFVDEYVNGMMVRTPIPGAAQRN